MLLEAGRAVGGAIAECGALASLHEANAYYTGRPDAVVFGPGGGCDPAYPAPCIPIGVPDIDRPEVGAVNVTVHPPDPHGFDRDVDGTGCEA